MTPQPTTIINPALVSPTRSRKANRRTLKGCMTQVERIQQQLRTVGMQYADIKPEVFKALHSLHENLDLCKGVLLQTRNTL